jgi:chaperonin GroEL
VGAKKIVYGAEARQRVLNGAIKLEKAVATTLGPKGRTVVIDNGTQDRKLTKDGVSVAKAISFKDAHEDIGANLVKEAASKTNTAAGDGTTTATILTVELMKRGNALVNVGIDATDVKRGYEAALDDVLQEMTQYVIPVRGEDDIKAVATVSSNDDLEIVENVVNAFTGIGDGGVVSLTDSFSRSGKTEVVFSSGLEFDRGFLSSICVNTASETYEAKEPRFLLFEEPVRDYSELGPVVKWAHDSKSDLIVIASTYDEEVVGKFYENVDKKIISGTLIMCPGYTKSTIDEWAKNLSAQLSAKSVRSGSDIEDFDKTLGKAGYVIVHKDKTTISDPLQDETALMARIEVLKNQLNDDTKTEMELTHIKEQLARMTGGIATIKIGANSELELREKKDRYEDAVNAVRAAIKGGIAPGGGAPLAKIQRKLKKKRLTNPAREKGYREFILAITKPAEKIIESTGQNPYEVLAKVASKTEQYGYDARAEKIRDVVTAGILDPALVTVSALKYATSIAASFVTMDATVTLDQDNLEIQPVDAIIQGM